ncbi:MAG: pirin family protein [Vampirovibrio sp.]|nr:pirin family protein [Vampirovibrio sp.]
MYATILNAGQSLEYQPPANRNIWLQVATGTIELDGQLLESGDAIGFSAEEQRLELKGLEDHSQVLIFNLR